jgi:translation initiation factor 1
MAAPKQRIPLNAPQAGLNAAFAALQLEGLPSGPVHEAGGGPLPAKPVRCGRVVLRREKAHRGGKVVVVVDGFEAQHSLEAIDALAKRLRESCGCGGTVRGRAVELQGEQAARARALLEAEGFQVAGER